MRELIHVRGVLQQSGRHSTLKLAVEADWWEVLKGYCESLRTGLAATVTQLEAQGNFSALLNRDDNPLRA